MRGNLQKIMIGLVVVIVLAFIFFSGDSLVKLVDTIKQGTPFFIIAAVVAQLCKYLAQGRGFQACFNTVNGHISYRTGLSLVFGTFFMNTVAPSMNLAGTSLVMATATRNGMQAGKGTTAALLMQLSIDSGFVIIMLTTFGVLTFTVGLQPGWLALGLVAVALVGGLVFVIAVGGLKPQLVLKVLRPFVKLADKILAKFKKPAIDESVERTIHNFSSAAHLITKNPRKTVQSFLWTTLSSICEMSCFVLVGFAFGVHHPEALICGYVVATLFAMISFVPQGVGVVEAAVTVAFALFGIDSATGLAVVIVYRGIVFWLPFLVGAVVIQRIKAFMPLGKRDLKGKAEAMEHELPDKVEAVKQVEADEVAKWDSAEARGREGVGVCGFRRPGRGRLRRKRSRRAPRRRPARKETRVMTGTNLTGAALEVAQKRETQGLNHTLGVHFTKVEPGLVEAEMPITPALLQPFGFLHGGATIALLESVASAGGELACDLETEQPFGVEVTIRHKKSGREGDVARGVAKLAERKPSSKAGYKLYWDVAAYDGDGDVISDGVIVVKVVPKDYLAQKLAERGQA